MPTKVEHEVLITTKKLTVQIEDLIKENGELIVKVNEGDVEIGRVKVALNKMDDERVELIATIEELRNEVGRLGMVLKHQQDNLESVRNAPPFKRD